MSIYKQIALILPAVFWRLIDENDFELILDMMDIVQFYNASSYSLNDARDVAMKTLAIIGKLTRRFYKMHQRQLM